jgi:hypothetical protein
LDDLRRGAFIPEAAARFHWDHQQKPFLFSVEKLGDGHGHTAWRNRSRSLGPLHFQKASFRILNKILKWIALAGFPSVSSSMARNHPAADEWSPRSKLGSFIPAARQQSEQLIRLPGHSNPRVVYTSRVAASASSASWFTVWRNFGVCPTNNPSAANDAIVATAPPNLSSLGRITAQCGKSGLMNSQGTGKIRLG